MKYAKKNEVSLNPIDYSLILLGESGIGKSTVIYETAEKLVGSEGYIAISIGNEGGYDCIQGVNYLNCPTWEQEYDPLTHSIGLNTLINDIVENKSVDYPELKMIVWDTLDQLFPIVEAEVIRRDNKVRRETGKPIVRGINEAMGGFMRGQDEVIAVIKDLESKLNSVGIRVWKVAHCKTKDVTDTFTGEPYQQLTAKLPQRYFSALKDEAPFMGLAYVDREFIKEKKRNNKDTFNIVKDETRKIKFRSEDYVVDNKSRFANIVDEIPLDSDALIKAMTDAIMAEAQKSGVAISEIKKKQDKINKEKEARIAEAEAKAKEEHALKDVVDEIIDFIQSNRTDMNVVQPIVEAIKNMGYGTPQDIDSLEDAEAILKLCK